jgi:hypothetical protein
MASSLLQDPEDRMLLNPNDEFMVHLLLLLRGRVWALVVKEGCTGAGGGEEDGRLTGDDKRSDAVVEGRKKRSVGRGKRRRRG